MTDAQTGAQCAETAASREAWIAARLADGAQECAHCHGYAKPDRRCRHGWVCGRCAWELDEWSGLHSNGAGGV